MGRSRAETSLLWSVTGTKSSDSVCLSRKPGPRGVLPLPSPPPNIGGGWSAAATF